MQIHRLVVKPILIVALGIIPSITFAQDQEREQLTLILEQLKNIEELTTRSRAIASIDNQKRYRFDYTQLSKDLDAIRTGINAYLTPTRAQPRRVMDFTGHYTQEDSHGR